MIRLKGKKETPKSRLAFGVFYNTHYKIFSKLSRTSSGQTLD